MQVIDHSLGEAVVTASCQLLQAIRLRYAYTDGSAADPMSMREASGSWPMIR